MGHFTTISTDAVVLFSGGIDSAACIHFLLKKGQRVRPLFIDYGQKAATPERAAAQKLSLNLKVELDSMTAATGVSLGAGEIKGRNAFLIFSAMLGGFCAGTGPIALGVHDGTPYYDCTPAFIDAVDRLVAEYTDGRRRVVAPFLNWSKRTIFNYFVSEGLPVESTYSCEAGEVPPCGSCLSCRDRRSLY